MVNNNVWKHPETAENRGLAIEWIEMRDKPKIGKILTWIWTLVLRVSVVSDTSRSSYQTTEKINFLQVMCSYSKWVFSIFDTSASITLFLAVHRRYSWFVCADDFDTFEQTPKYDKCQSVQFFGIAVCWVFRNSLTSSNSCVSVQFKVNDRKGDYADRSNNLSKKCHRFKLATGKLWRCT